MEERKIYHGDCLEILKQLPDESIKPYSKKCCSAIIKKKGEG